MPMMPILAAVLAATTSVTPQADKLQAGEQCYAMSMGGRTRGATSQVIKPVSVDGRRAWDIVVHQKVADGSFDMRDHFVVDRATLRPISFDSQRGASRDSKGWHRIALRYGPDRISGTRETAAGATAIDVPLDHAVWEGNLWGVTFASLPLHQGGRYTLPFWQYDKGFGTFTVNVLGRQPAHVAGRTVKAWVVEAGDDPAHLARYVVADGTPMEISYTSGPFAQQPGGDCTSFGATGG